MTLGRPIYPKTAAALCGLVLLAGCTLNPPRSAQDLPKTDYAATNAIGPAAAEESKKLLDEQTAIRKRIENIAPPKPGAGLLAPVAPVYDPLEDKVVTINMYDADVGKLLYALSDQLGMNLIVDPQVLALQQHASLYLRNVTAREVYDHILQAFDLHGETRGGALVVSLMEDRMFHLDMLNTQTSLDLSTGGDVFGAGNTQDSGGGGDSLRGKLVMDGTVTKATDPYKQLDGAVKSILAADQGGDKEEKARYSLDTMTGSLFVRARPSKVRAIESLIDANKKMLGRQVLVEAQLIDVQLNDNFSFGVDWTVLRNRVAGIYGDGTLTQAPSTSPYPAPHHHSLEPSSITIPQKIIGSAAGRGLGLSYLGDSFQAALSALRSFGNVRVLSNPSVRMRNGTPAYLAVGTNYRYVTKVTNSFSNPGGGATTSSSDVETSSLFSGVVIGVAPFIHDDGDIELLVHPMQTELVPGTLERVDVGNGNSVTLPQINFKGITTTLNVKDGDTVLLGGLIDQSVSNNDSGIPGVSDIPAVGKLFDSKTNSHDSRELVMVLRVHVL
jgi:general secretion pathway protein D